VGVVPEKHRHLEARARLLEARLERLSVDSGWARRSSGLRGSLLKYFEELERGTTPDEEQMAHLSLLVRRGFFILHHAARQMRGSGLR
jgi:hypothetical protein